MSITNSCGITRDRGGRAYGRRVRLLASAVALLGLTSCGSDREVDTENPVAATASLAPSPEPTPSSTPTAIPEDGAILDAYRAFFAAQTDISLAPAGERRAMLEPLATDPLLSRVLGGMLAADHYKEVGYGTAEVDPEVTSVDGDEATIKDCQDTSDSGRKNRKTGKIVTRGTPEAKVVATARRDADGTWRLATVEYRDDRC